MPTVFFLILFFFPLCAPAATNDECLECHNLEQFVHGGIACADCHNDVKKAPHEEKPAKVDCGICHSKEKQTYISSDHYSASENAMKKSVACSACHGDPHYILSQDNPESLVSRKNINKTCAKCHDNPEVMRPYHKAEREAYKSYQKSVHGRGFQEGVTGVAVCTDCHGSHDINLPSNHEAKIYKFNVPATCGKCHGAELEDYKKSIHAKALFKGMEDAPVCTDCHGEHSIESPARETSSVFSSSISKTCSYCHASEKITKKYGLPTRVEETYLESYHGIALRTGSSTTANCASCHGFHDILPSTDPRSKIHKDNIGKTCGKCHAGAGEQLSQGSVHIRPSFNSDVLLYVVRTFYTILILVVIGGMVLHNAIDLAKKLKRHYKNTRESEILSRMTLSERIQHIILLVSFIILVYSGFAHKYPNAFFSYPFNLFEWGAAARRGLHFAAGGVFIAYIIYHICWMIFTRHGREKLTALLPAKQDFLDAFNLLKYNLGMAEARPRFGRYSYIEKAEYWALIWGSIIMILTGIVLMFKDYSLMFMPKWLIDLMLVLHLFEAILATLAIIVWHFYWVIFDPHIYPMNWTWISGKITKEQAEERK